MLDDDQVETVFLRLRSEMPGRTPDANGPKGLPDAFWSCASCMLSKQSPDRNTARASQALFALAATPENMLELDDRDIAAAIKPAGLYNVKTRNLRKFCETLLAEYGEVVPSTRDGLQTLPGIGRKCADIVQSFTFAKDVIAVDTHVHRVCNRTGLTCAKTADATASQLEQRAPDWALRDGYFWLIQFGKKVCVSRAQMRNLPGQRSLPISCGQPGK